MGLVFLSAAAPASFAQQVRLRGKVEDVQHTQNQFFVDGTDVQLSSTMFDLNPFVGLQTELRGDWNGSFSSPAIVVTAIEVVPETFEIGGGGKIGEKLVFGVTSTPGDFTVMLAALDNGFAPTRRSGVFPPRPQPAARDRLRRDPGGGNLEIDVSIPDDPILVGLEVLGQAILRLSAGGSLWTNPDCKTIDS